MKNAHTDLASKYERALRAYVCGDFHAATFGRTFGQSAMAAGLIAQDLALIHERALNTLASRRDSSGASTSGGKKAGHFFRQALIPLDAAQRAKDATNQSLQHRNDSLRLQAEALARGNARLKSEIIRRKAGELALRKGRKEYKKLLAESQIMQVKLREVTRHIILAQEEERKQISRELHDEVVQTLVGINVQLSALSKGASVGLHTLKAKIVRTQRLVEHSVKAVHRFARELRPVVLDHLGLIPALHAYSKSLAARKKIRIRLTAFGGVEALGNAKRTVLYRVAQEALTNVGRHAQATHVSVSISEAPGAIRMEISDNGKSFPVEKTLLARNNKRLGLVGMRERVEMVGGTLTIESAPTTGTTIRAEIPFNAERQQP
jgi:signal transduction histidine kinase